MKKLGLASPDLESFPLPAENVAGGLEEAFQLGGGLGLARRPELHCLLAGDRVESANQCMTKYHSAALEIAKNSESTIFIEFSVRVMVQQSKMFFYRKLRVTMVQW